MSPGLVLTPLRFLLLFKIYSVFQRDKLYKRGFNSLHDLGCVVEGSQSASSSFKDFARELLDEGVLFLKDNSLFLDEERLDGVVEKYSFWVFFDEYYSDRQSPI